MLNEFLKCLIPHRAGFLNSVQLYKRGGHDLTISKIYSMIKYFELAIDIEIHLVETV
jgi:hypothetical protein